MSGSERFSVNNTQIRRFTADGKPLVEKTIRCNTPLPISLDMLMGYMDAYRGELGGVGIVMPAIADGRVDGDSITYVCEDGGRNLVEIYETPHTLVHDYPDVLSGVIEILRRAAAAGLCIDPHIKNFTVEGTNLRYVDFSPPLVEPYIEARCWPWRRGRRSCAYCERTSPTSRRAIFRTISLGISSTWIVRRTASFRLCTSCL